MDSQIVNQKAILFKDRTLRITPALFEQFGLIKKNVYIKIEEFYLSCVPFDLSLSGCSLLAFLSPREITFFEQFKGKPHRLYLSFIPPYTKKPISYFVVSDVLDYRKSDPSSPYSFIDLKFKDAPFDLKEMLVTYFVEIDDSEQYFSTVEAEPVTQEGILKVLGSPHVTVSRDDLEFPRIKVLQLSAKTIRLFGEIDLPALAAGSVLEMESEAAEDSGVFEGTVTEVTPLAEAPGFVFLSLDLKFNPGIIAKIRKLPVT